jgi:hypothetical protein
VRDDERWSAEPDVLPTYHRLIRRGGVNRVAIYGASEHFTLLINGQAVAVCTIGGLPGTSVDVAVIARRDVAAVGMFANFELRVPSQV